MMFYYFCCGVGMVLEETEDKKDLIAELQGKIQRRINGLVADQKEVHWNSTYLIVKAIIRYDK